MARPVEPHLVPAAGPLVTGEFDVSTREDVPKLRKHAVGLWGVLFLTVTGSAPISAMLFNTPISVGFGNGVGTPAGFLFATVVLTIFSVGYVAMARKKTAAGGFYSYISHGLGREIGMGTGFGSVVAYSVFEASLCGGFAYFMGAKMDSIGVHLAWPWWALLMVVLISLITYFDVSISVRLLGLALVGEFVILLIFDAFMFARGVNFNAINPINAFQGFPATKTLLAGAAGIGIFYAFWSWVGFEMAPNYGEESRDPKRIVPRAMYISVIGLGIFYTITSWASLSGYNSVTDAIAKSQTDPLNYFLAPAHQYAAAGVADVMSILIITGSFACGMAFHNTTARYLYSLGREGVLPSALGRTHPKYKSPHIASITQSVIAAAIVIGFAWRIGSNDPTSQAYLQLYGLMALMGVIIILAVQALVSLSILIYFQREHRTEVHWWTTVVAPLISFVAQIVVLILLFQNVQFLGSGYGYANWLGPIDLVVVAIGIAGAFYLKQYQPKKYQVVGRLINEGL
jgi:amino acid transporter